MKLSIFVSVLVALSAPLAMAAQSVTSESCVLSYDIEEPISIERPDVSKSEFTAAGNQTQISGPGLFLNNSVDSANSVLALTILSEDSHGDGAGSFSRSVRVDYVSPEFAQVFSIFPGMTLSMFCNSRTSN